MSKKHLVIFDTTLRDGEQSPGASMTADEKLRIAKMLENMRVDVIEAGFPAASEGDFLAVKAVATTIKDSVVCGLCRALAHDIERAGEALKNANAARIHTFIATSPIHMKYKLRLSPDAVVEHAVAAIKLARDYTDDVEFSCEDASRSEFEFLCRIVEQAIAAGATTINLPDTVGYGEPMNFGAMVGRLMATVANADQAIFSVHCHNDLGLAVANSLSAVLQGARQVECTINGLGERAGNASLEEVVMAVRTRGDIFSVETRVDPVHIVPLSRLVSTITGFPVQPNKAIVGANAFAHESGIHQAGVLRHRETYEIMRAEDVGWQANKLVLGKHSGRAAVKARFESLGFTFDNHEALDEIFTRFKTLADKKHEVFDEDLQALLSDVASSAVPDLYQLVALESHSKTGTAPSATLSLRVVDEIVTASAKGSGPVDAAFKAIAKICQDPIELQLYSVNAITMGTDSQGEVMVRLAKNGVIVNGSGADTDIIVASVKAYLQALNGFATKPTGTHCDHGI